MAVFKNRFTADVRTIFLDDLGKDRDLYPVRSDEALKYLNKQRNKEGKKNLRFGFVYEFPSEKFLIGFMFFAFAVILYLTIYTFMEIYYGWPPLIPEEKENQLLVRE